MNWPGRHRPTRPVRVLVFVHDQAEVAVAAPKQAVLSAPCSRRVEELPTDGRQDVHQRGSADVWELSVRKMDHDRVEVLESGLGRDRVLLNAQRSSEESCLELLHLVVRSIPALLRQRLAALGDPRVQLRELRLERLQPLLLRDELGLELVVSLRSRHARGKFNDAQERRHHAASVACAESNIGAGELSLLPLDNERHKVCQRASVAQRDERQSVARSNAADHILEAEPIANVIGEGA